jgi:MYXO-CTERM domain-containing protein
MAGLALTAPTTARACSCFQPKVTAPANGAVDVPPNTKLWYVADGISSGQALFTLTGPQGEIPLSAVELGDLGYLRGFVLTPERELNPGAYRLALCQAAKPCSELTAFTVAQGRADEPRIPVERGGRSEWYRKGDPGSSCGPDPSRFAILDFDWEGLLLLADVAEANPYPADPARLFYHAFTATEIERGGGVWVGAGACTPYWPRSAEGIADSAPVRFGAVNLAGEFSGWSEPVTVQLPEGCGCRLGGAGGGSAAWIAVALGLCGLLRRRRSRPPAS